MAVDHKRATPTAGQQVMGDGMGSVGPIHVRGQLPLLFACSVYSSSGSGQECRSSLMCIGLDESISNQMLRSC